MWRNPYWSIDGSPSVRCSIKPLSPCGRGFFASCSPGEAIELTRVCPAWPDHLHLLFDFLRRKFPSHTQVRFVAPGHRAAVLDPDPVPPL